MSGHDQSWPLRIAVSGASGLLGRELCSRLASAGHAVVRLVRDINQVPPEQRESADPVSSTEAGSSAGDLVVAPWHSANQVKRLEGVEAIIHLAGKSIAEQRWSAAVKQQIYDSRVTKTCQLSEALATLDHPPHTLICASAIGIYGDRGDEVLSETSPPGNGFLPEVAVQWEAACRPAEVAGIRVVKLRLGVVLSRQAGALPQMLLPTKLGLGGPLGSGRQWWSWIDLADACRAIEFALATPSLSGPINLVAPQAERQRDFATALSAVLHRPAFVPTPALVLRLALGEMAGPLLLASTRVEPVKLLASGFRFEFGELRDSLQHLLRPAD